MKRPNNAGHQSLFPDGSEIRMRTNAKMPKTMARQQQQQQQQATSLSTNRYMHTVHNRFKYTVIVSLVAVIVLYNVGHNVLFFDGKIQKQFRYDTRRVKDRNLFKTSMFLRQLLCGRRL